MPWTSFFPPQYLIDELYVIKQLFNNPHYSCNYIAGDFGYALIDPNIRAGMEVGMYNCEKSTRQMWRLNSNSSLELFTTAIDTEATDGYMAQVCIGPGDDNRPFLSIIICEGAARASLVLTHTSAGQLIEQQSSMCVTLVGGVGEPGALLNLSPCEPKYPAAISRNVRLEGVRGEGEGEGGIEGLQSVKPHFDYFLAADNQVFSISPQGTFNAHVFTYMCVRTCVCMLQHPTPFLSFDNPTHTKTHNDAIHHIMHTHIALQYNTLSYTYTLLYNTLHYYTIQYNTIHHPMYIRTSNFFTLHHNTSPPQAKLYQKWLTCV